jgi:hypothetical protein
MNDLKNSFYEQRVKPNIDEETEQFMFRVMQVIDIDKSLGIGNRLYKLNRLKRNLQDFLGIENDI